MAKERNHPSFDVAIVGSGVTGLMLAKKLSGLGVTTALIEKEKTLANGPSTRNEGWLHRGTYHATSIKDRETAIQVAKRCIYGHEQIKSFAPEAVEDIDLPSYALISDKERVSEITSRWDEAEVLYQNILLKVLADIEPNVNISNASEAFKVNDVGINTRVLYRKLLNTSVQQGTHLFTNTEIQFESPEDAFLVSNGDREPFKSTLYVYTSGFGTKQLVESQLKVPLPLRYWKSHLMIVPRLTRSSVFFLDPHEAAMMNHGDYSIVGLNEDAFICDQPDYDCLDQGVENIFNAMDRAFHTVDKTQSLPVACIKTDFAIKSGAARSLNISISEPLPNHISVLPGKMTESPYVTDVVTRYIYDRLGDDLIALRPMDTI